MINVNRDEYPKPSKTQKIDRKEEGKTNTNCQNSMERIKPQKRKSYTYMTERNTKLPIPSKRPRETQRAKPKQ